MNLPRPLAACVAFVLCALAALPAGAAPQGIVISQVYGGGGNSGATLRNDFIELFNAGSSAVNLNGWSVQYASATGSTWQVTSLAAASLAPGQYYLVQQAQGAGGTASLPTPDATGTIAMGATAGKVALVANTVPLSGANPSGGALQDLVGYGPTATGFEGAPTAALTNTTALLRAAQGCTDANDNTADFAIAAPSPRNTASALNVCGGGGTNLPIIATCPATTVASGATATAAVSATDGDGIVAAPLFTGSLPAGFSIVSSNAASGVGAAATALLDIAASVSAAVYSLPVAWSNNQGQSATCTLVVTVSGVTRIYAIQGSGPTSPLVGTSVTTQGVVTKLSNNGFFLQDAVGDGNPSTSDGIFVFTSTAPTVSLGQLLQLSGTVTEFNSGAAGNADTAAHTVTELTNITGVTVLASGFAVAPVSVTLPEAVNDELERYEGMLVTLEGPLTASQNFFQGRYGQVTLSAQGRLEVPTNRLRPGPDALALANQNARRRILLDDGTSVQNPNPTPYFAADNTLRAGDTVESITGVIDYGLATSSNTDPGDYKIHPTQPVAFTRANPRTAAPAAVGGNVKVASFNLLNYFTTFTDGTTATGQTGQGCTLAGATSAANCRGADNAAEFVRQRNKIISALAAINADAVGLIEMQNNGATAVQNLVDGLNTAVGAGTYAAVPDPASGTGTDAIKVAMIYQPAKLSRIAATLQSDTAAIHNRPPLAQTFAAPNGERFTLVVNHFKSKGCDGAAGADLDQGDLQGCFNDRRTQQAVALRAFVSSLQAAAGTGDVVLVGDFNAYAQEDPVFDLTSNGFIDQIGRFNSFGYSYVFDGAAGRLDNALANASLSAKVRGAVEWHINADEPSVIDYNLEFKLPACATCGPDYYSATPYRASDHDPVVLGLLLVKTINGTEGRDTLVGTAGDDVITGGAGADTLTGGAGRDVFVYLSMRDAGDTITDFAPGTDRLDLRALLASIGYAGSNPVGDGVVRFIDSSAGATVQIDADGIAGAGLPRALLLLRGVSAAQIVPTRDLVL